MDVSKQQYATGQTKAKANYIYSGIKPEFK